VTEDRRPRGRSGRPDLVNPASSGDGAGGIEAENRELRKRTNSWSRRTRSPAGRRPTSPATPLPNDVPAGPRPGRRQDPVAVTAGCSASPRKPSTNGEPTRSASGDGDAHLINAAIRQPPRRPRIRLPVHHRRNPHPRRDRQPQPGQPTLLPQRIYSAHAKRRRRSPPRATRPRRPGRPRVPRRRAQRAVLTDITERPTGEAKLYLCAIKDACSNRIVGYSMDARMTAQLAVDALGNAAAPCHAATDSRNGPQLATRRARSGPKLRHLLYLAILALYLSQGGAGDRSTQRRRGVLRWVRGERL